MVTIDQAFTETVAEYAHKLRDAGFTVYASTNPRTSLSDSWFHYSVTVDGVERFGTFSAGEWGTEPEHSMPITPSRLNGSSAGIGARWGDDATLGLDNVPADSVKYARIVARAENWCPYCAEPTREATNIAAHGAGVPQKYYRGAMLKNAEPWGIGTQYVPVEG